MGWNKGGLLTIFNIKAYIDLMQHDAKIVGTSVCHHHEFERCGRFVVVELVVACPIGYEAMSG